MYYAQSTGGFFDVAIHGKNIPADAVKITQEDHAALLAGQVRGKEIAADKNGHPVLADPPKPSAEQIWSLIKAKRDRLTEHGGCKVDGKWFHSDSMSRSQQLSLVLLGSNLPANLQWKTMDGSFVTMTPQLAQAVMEGASANDLAIFAAAEIHRSELEASDNFEKYDFSSGWPELFEK
jgi:hypothetical protein